MVFGPATNFYEKFTQLVTKRSKFLLPEEVAGRLLGSASGFGSCWLGGWCNGGLGCEQ
jgi:hypothetical protein